MYSVEMYVPMNIEDLTAEVFGKILSDILTEDEILKLINGLKEERAE